MTRQPQPGDRGSGTVLQLAMAAAAALIIFAVSLVGRAVVLRHRAESAADLAALAGASAIPPSCRAAQMIASANGAVLTSCWVAADQSVRVTVQAQVGDTTGFGRFLVASAQAHAGRPP